MERFIKKRQFEEKLWLLKRKKNNLAV